MRSSSRSVSAGIALVFAVLASPAAAHHSFAAFFDMVSVKEIQGRLTRILWANPHIKIYVAATDGKTWEAEAGSLILLKNMGIETSMLTIGDEIHVRGNPGLNDAPTLWVSNILVPRPVRTELLATPGAQPYGPWEPVKVVGKEVFVKPRPLDYGT